MNQVGGAQTFMGLANIKKIIIPVPPIELQKQFAAFVEQTDKSKFEIQQSLEKLETLKKALMQKYFG
jgi:type I restriction enzyme S subunit